MDTYFSNKSLNRLTEEIDANLDQWLLQMTYDLYKRHHLENYSRKTLMKKQ